MDMSYSQILFTVWYCIVLFQLIYTLWATNSYIFSADMFKLARPTYSATLHPFVVYQRCPYSTTSSTRTSQKKSLYEILDLSDTASSSEIRKAFISKSKKSHPDVNPGRPDQHNVFVEINEAYKVLSNPSSRKTYDLQLQQRSSTPVTSYNYTSGNPFGNVPKHRQTPSSYDPKHDTYSQQRSYNFTKATSPQRTLYNRLIFFGAFLFMLSGSTVIFFLIRARHHKYRAQVEESSRQANLVYMAARERARTNGLKKQLEILIAGSQQGEVTDLSARSLDDLKD